MSHPLHRTPSRRSFLAGVSALALLPVLAACGDDGESTASGSETTASAELPVTIEHKYGSTTITEVPKRVVCVGLTDQDTLLALGVIPVATTSWYGEAPGLIFPWAEKAFAAAGGTEENLPEVLDAANGVPVEKIAALAPDLIVAQYSGLTKKEYELLSKIAKVVAQPADHDDYTAPWDVMATAIGTAIGQKTQVEKLIADVKAQVADQAKAHPEFKDRSAVVVTPYEGLFVYGATDVRTRLLGDLGFDIANDLISTDNQFGGSLSAERTADLDKVDLTVWYDLTADKQVSGLYEQTEAYQEGRFVDIGESSGSYYVAQGFVTPLGIPYTLERFVPQLAAAVDGDPKTKVPAVTS